MVALSLGSSMTLFDVAEVEKALHGLEDLPMSSQQGLSRMYRKMLDSGPARWVSKPSAPLPSSRSWMTARTSAACWRTC
jgi:hypothetical protein